MTAKNNFVFVFAVIVSLPALLLGQTPELDWVIPMGTIGRESGNSIVTDVEGNVYTVGYFENTKNISLELYQPAGIYVAEFKNGKGQKSILKIVKE